MKKQKKILCGVLSLFCAGALCAGIVALPVTAEDATVSNKDFFTATGGTLAVTEGADGLKLSLSNVSKTATNRDVVSVYYNNYISVSDLATGITLLNSSATATREFDFMSVVLRDSEDPTQVMTLHLQYAAWSGAAIETASVGLWDEFSYASTGKQSYVYDGEMTSGAAATREFLAYADGRYVYQNGSDGCLRLGAPAKILWGKDGEVVPFTFTYSNSVVKISSHNRTVADLSDAKYFEKAIANVSESEQPDLYDNLNEEYAANLFLSGNVTMELQFGNVKDGAFDVCIQKIGNTSLSLESQNNFQSTSVSGTTYTGTAIPITSEIVKLPGKYSAADIQTGFMFQVLPSVISTPAAGHVRVIIRDSEDPTKAVTAGLLLGAWSGQMKAMSIYKAGVWDRMDTLKWSDGTTEYSISTSNDMNASARDEFGNSSFGANNYHGFFSADGTNKTATNALKVAYNGTTLSCNGRNTAGKVSASTILTSGYATIELQFGVVGTSYTLNGNVNLISVGNTSLANIAIGSADPLVDNMKPVINAGASFDVEAGKAYTMDEIKAFATASDNIGVSEFTAVVYNSEDIAYEGESFTFAANAGDYIVYTAKDQAGNQTTKTINVTVAKSFVVTKIVDGVETTEVVADGYSYVLEAATVEGEVFVGWEIGGKLYPANYTLLVEEDVTAVAVAIEFNMVLGASIRIDTNLPGIRWAATLAEGDKDALGSYATEWGVRVTSESKTGFLAIPVEKWVDDGKTEFRCAMTDMDDSVEDGLYDIEFEGRAYVKVTYADGTKTTIWAIANDNIRSIRQVAVNVYDQVSPEMQVILDEFITVNGDS